MAAREAGFTLVEMLAATAVFTLVISIFYGGVQQGRRALEAAEAEGAAVMVAKSVIAAAGIETPLSAGGRSGISPNGVHWTSAVRPYLGFAQSSAAQPGLSGYWIDVTVSWQNHRFAPEKSLRLTTLKLSRAP